MAERQQRTTSRSALPRGAPPRRAPPQAARIAAAKNSVSPAAGRAIICPLLLSRGRCSAACCEADRECDLSLFGCGRYSGRRRAGPRASGVAAPARPGFVRRALRVVTFAKSGSSARASLAQTYAARVNVSMCQCVNVIVSCATTNSLPSSPRQPASSPSSSSALRCCTVSWRGMSAAVTATVTALIAIASM
jgi:hypothetical protein